MVTHASILLHFCTPVFRVANLARIHHFYKIIQAKSSHIKFVIRQNVSVLLPSKHLQVGLVVGFQAFATGGAIATVGNNVCRIKSEPSEVMVTI